MLYNTDAKWTHSGYDEWWDPDGWWYPGYGDPTSSPVPHVHRVPCTKDTAVFVDPNQSLYSVHLTAPTIRVARLTIGDKVWLVRGKWFSLYLR